MIDFIPAENYTQIWYSILLILVLSTYVQLRTNGNLIFNTNRKDYKTLILLFFVIFYMGLRPLNIIFVDMTTYNSQFERYANGAELSELSVDYLWNVFMKFCSTFMTAKMFFFICVLLYVVPIYIASKKWVGANNYYLFLMVLASLSFWTYGTNGIRNGIATSFFVLAVSSTKKTYFKYGLLVVSYFIHGSLIIPLAAFVLTLFYKNPKKYLLGWLLAIPLSLLFGSFWEIFFSSFSIIGDRAIYLTQGNINNDSFAYTGFRWDFLLYSFFAIYSGYYFIVKRKFKDILYIQLFNLYVITNTLWILVIRANFSNRFAYLSWFLMAFVIFYPFLKAEFFKKQQTVLAYTILFYFGFTYLIFLTE
jgi:hypothetical protein